MNSARRKFVELLGEYYERYGYPEIGGWIEGLLTIETEETWSQQSIADRLQQLFGNSDKPTSLSSVNRTLKFLENYGTIIKEGSRKIGYTYQITPISTYTTSMLEKFIKVNKEHIDALNELKKDIMGGEDKKLLNTIEDHVTWIKILNQEFNKAVSSIQNSIESYLHPKGILPEKK